MYVGQWVWEGGVGALRQHWFWLHSRAVHRRKHAWSEVTDLLTSVHANYWALSNPVAYVRALSAHAQAKASGVDWALLTLPPAVRPALPSGCTTWTCLQSWRRKCGNNSSSNSRYVEYGLCRIRHGTA